MSPEIVVTHFGSEEKAKNILKAELSKRGISYQKLAELLVSKGWNLNKAAIDNRMSRGAFSADFFLDALRVIGYDQLGVLIDKPENH